MNITDFALYELRIYEYMNDFIVDDVYFVLVNMREQIISTKQQITKMIYDMYFFDLMEVDLDSLAQVVLMIVLAYKKYSARMLVKAC